MSKITDEMIEKFYLSNPMSLHRTAKRLKVGVQRVYDVVSCLEEYKPFKAGVQGILSEQEVERMKAMYNSGTEIQVLMDHFSIKSTSTLYRYLKDVPRRNRTCKSSKQMVGH